MEGTIDWWLWNHGRQNRLVVVESWKAQSTGGCGIMEGTIDWWLWNHGRHNSFHIRISCPQDVNMIVVFWYLSPGSCVFVYLLFILCN